MSADTKALLVYFGVTVGLIIAEVRNWPTWAIAFFFGCCAALMTTKAIGCYDTRPAASQKGEEGK